MNYVHLISHCAVWCCWPGCCRHWHHRHTTDCLLSPWASSHHLTTLTSHSRPSLLDTLTVHNTPADLYLLWTVNHACKPRYCLSLLSCTEHRAGSAGLRAVTARERSVNTLQPPVSRDLPSRLCYNVTVCSLGSHFTGFANVEIHQLGALGLPSSHTIDLTNTQY